METAMPLTGDGPLPILNTTRFRLILPTGNTGDTSQTMQRTRLEKYDESGAYIPLTASKCAEPAFLGNTLTLHTTLFRELEEIERTCTSDKPYFTREQVVAHVLEFEETWRRIEPAFGNFTFFQGLACTLNKNKYRVKWTM